MKTPNLTQTFFGRWEEKAYAGLPNT
jgi:hypothetical protein